MPKTVGVGLGLGDAPDDGMQPAGGEREEAGGGVSDGFDVVKELLGEGGAALELEYAFI